MKQIRVLGDDGKIRYVCHECGKVFDPTFYWNNKWYCTIQCSIKYRENRKRLEREKRQRKKQQSKNAPMLEQRKCKYCGNEYTWSSLKPGQKYCSKQCCREATKERYRKDKSKKPVIPSDEKALEAFVRNLVETLNYYNGLQNDVQTFFPDRYLADDKAKQEALNRDNRRCRICGRNTSLHVHHIRKRRDGGKNDLDNLITLCSSCHRAIETGDVEHAIHKCKKRWKNPTDSIWNDLEYIQKAKTARKELEKLYDMLSEDGEACGISSIKVYIDKILDGLE